MEETKFNSLRAFIDKNKGKRKFKQSVELAINFSGINFGKAENRLNLEVRLPNGRGKNVNAVVFADDKNIVERSTAVGATVIRGADLPTIATDKAKMALFLKSELVAQPSLMPQIAKTLGQFLGPRNKMPRPLAGNDVAAFIANMGNSVYIRSKGKYLPTVHCIVGKEDMPAEKLAANIDQVLDSVAKKVGRQNLRSVYVKLTMSKPIRLV